MQLGSSCTWPTRRGLDSYLQAVHRRCNRVAAWLGTPTVWTQSSQVEFASSPSPPRLTRCRVGFFPTKWDLRAHARARNVNRHLDFTLGLVAAALRSESILLHAGQVPDPTTGLVWYRSISTLPRRVTRSFRPTVSMKALAFLATKATGWRHRRFECAASLPRSALREVVPPSSCSCHPIA